MRIHLFVTTLNNEELIGKFIDFYREKVPTIVVHVWDKGSTDKTIEIAKSKSCIVNNFHDFFRLENDWKNECWKNTTADTVVVCTIKDFIDLDLLLFNNCTVIQCKGYNVGDGDFLPSEDTRDPNYDVYAIFDKRAIKDMHYDGDNINPEGFVKIGERKPNLYHTK